MIIQVLCQRKCHGKQFLENRGNPDNLFKLIKLAIKLPRDDHSELVFGNISVVSPNYEKVSVCGRKLLR